MRRVFFSFHHKADHWRASQVRNMGVIEGNTPVSDNDWETIKRGGDAAIERWIAEQLKGKSCTVVLIGAHTAGRKWIKHEIRESWSAGKGVVGIYVHNLRDKNRKCCSMGRNPFDEIVLKQDNVRLSSIVKAYDPFHLKALARTMLFGDPITTYIYKDIKDNIGQWVEEAIKIRADY